MNLSNFRAALRASARVALTTTVFSCGGVAERPLPGQAAGPNLAAAADGSTTEDAATRAACTAPGTELFPEAQHTDASVSEPTFECCLAALDPILGGDAPAALAPDAGALTPSERSCCEAVIFRLDEDSRASVTPSSVSPIQKDNALLADAGEAAVRWRCCGALSFPDGPTCTPWGPPTPPEMPLALRDPEAKVDGASRRRPGRGRYEEVTSC